MKGGEFSPKYYPSNWTGGSRGNIKTYNLGKSLGKASVIGTAVLGTIEVGNGIYTDYGNYQRDGYTNGKNTTVAGTKVIVGATVGWAAGAATGALIGSSAAPIVGTIAGAIVGGAAGYLASEEVGNFVESSYK